MPLTLKKTLSVLAAMSVLCVLSAPAGASFGDGAEGKTLRCKYKIARSLMQLGKRQMRIRNECATRQAAGVIHAGVNCLGDPANGRRLAQRG